jgi:localization factor PodJL
VGEFWANLEKSVSAPPKPRRSIFRSPRVLMGILVLLGMIPAALFFLPRAPANEALPAVESMVPPEGRPRTGIGAATESAPAMPARDGAQAPAAPADPMPSKQQTLGPEPQSRAERYEDVAAPTPIGMSGRIDTASLPDSIVTGRGAAPAARQLAESQSDSRMAFVPGAPPAPVTTAALQDTAVRLNGVAAPDASQADSAKPLALPPALVGPYSLRLAAAQGDPSAQYEVAVRLAQGKGDTDQDLKEAAQWYQRAATSGFAMAQFRLGTLFERGVGVTTDSARAQVWYSRAAEQGNVKAMHNLAVLIAASSKPDYALAARWFTEAAERGLYDSQYNLAMLYENGLGVGKDPKTAYKWLLLAAKSNDAESKRRRDAVAATLTPEVRAAVEDATKAWHARRIDPVANDSRLAGQAWKQRASRNG